MSNLLHSTAYAAHSRHLARIRAAGVGAIVGIDWLYVPRLIRVVRIIEGRDYSVVVFTGVEKS